MKTVFECLSCGKEITLMIEDNEAPIVSCPYCKGETKEILRHSPLPWRIGTPDNANRGSRKKACVIDADGYYVCGPMSGIMREENKRFIVKLANEYYAKLNGIDN